MKDKLKLQVIELLDQCKAEAFKQIESGEVHDLNEIINSVLLDKLTQSLEPIESEQLIATIDTSKVMIELNDGSFLSLEGDYAGDEDQIY